MIVVTGRDFRANQSKYIGGALRGEDVIVKSRMGSVKLVPVMAEDMVASRNEISPALARKIEKARLEFREGKGITLRTHEDVDRYFEAM